MEISNVHADDKVFCENNIRAYFVCYRHVENIRVTLRSVDIPVDRAGSSSCEARPLQSSDRPLGARRVELYVRYDDSGANATRQRLSIKVNEIYAKWPGYTGNKGCIWKKGY